MTDEQNTESVPIRAWDDLHDYNITGSNGYDDEPIEAVTWDILEAARHRLYRFLRYRTMFDYQWAQDLTQLTLEKAYRARDSFRPESQLLPWLITIARNAHTDEYRRSRTLSLDELLGDEDTDAPEWLTELLAGEEPEDIVIAQEEEEATAALVGAMLEQIGRLEEPDRTILSMRARGEPHQAIADAVSLSESAVRKRVERARRRLKETLENVSHFPGQSYTL